MPADALDLTTLSHPFRYRVLRDPEGRPMIPGKLGRLETHDGATLAVYTDRPRLFTRLWAVPGVRRWQVGDREGRGLVPVNRLPGRHPDPGPQEASSDIRGSPREGFSPHVERLQPARSPSSVISCLLVGSGRRSPWKGRRVWRPGPWEAQ
jgi:hypothetical protein